jgi:hypothetical protein
MRVNQEFFEDSDLTTVPVRIMRPSEYSQLSPISCIADYCIDIVGKDLQLEVPVLAAAWVTRNILKQ